MFWVSKGTGLNQTISVMVKSPVDIRKSRRFWRITGFLGLAIILTATLITQPNRIQNTIAKEARATLQGEGMSTVTVDVDGRDLNLSGTVSTRDKLSETLAAAVTVPGIRVLTQKLSNRFGNETA